MNIIENLDPKLGIYALLFIVSNKLQVTMDKSQNDLTAKQWFLLASLQYMDQPASLKQVAENLDYSHQNVRQLANKLADKGYLTIKKDPDDLRALQIEVTDKVDQWARTNHDFIQDFLQQLYANLDPKDLQITAQTLNQLYENLGAIYESL